ncbi:hypothetical protein SUGI_0193240 [Cryptomeria japonica]|uniref:uncharacterized protein LOC131054637 n=1 Tax=Cryptomeria japonica TaxID=3369 RepID=UPI002408EF43|nr:uncharacterized protein LOC131054637 [Cryptomeria japonica]XP_057845172.2 uncharacterized protein LOC131054637 [Cryptomeria japonica]GLJ12543.1 hypothetical protein SUGI_0193240 [Cryptomeria japonica]
MNLDFIQNLWLPKFVLKLKQGAEIETINNSGPSSNYYGNTDSCKSSGVECGIWEQFWRRWEFKKVIVPKPETCGNLKKTEPSKRPKEGIGDWHLPWEQFWQRQEFGKAIMRRPEQRVNLKKPEPSNCMKEEGFGVWYLSWPVNSFATTSIIRPRNNSINCNGKSEIRKSQQNRCRTFKLGIWEVPWWINKNEVVSISSAKKNNSNGRVYNKSRQVWFPFGGINQADIASIHRSKNKNNARKIENSKLPSNKSWFDKLSVWDLFQSINRTETSSTPKSFNNKNTVKIENKGQQDRSHWVVLRWINQTETAAIPRSEKKRNDRTTENRKYLKDRSLQDSFGVWELFWQKNDTEKARFFKPNWNDGKMGNIKPVPDRSSQGRIGVWELFSQMYRREREVIPKSEKVGNKEKLETMKPLSDRFSVWKAFWQINQNGTASISGLEKNGNELIENNKPLQDLLIIWENVQQIKLPWNAKHGEQATNTETNELEFETLESGCTIPKFTPYMATVPWHTGPRAFLSQMFPRYGNYCGPNWSSGKDQGGLLWDKKPIDWLDYCCYCHDIGYDTHDQADMLKADITFLECLEKSWGSNNKISRAAEAYRSMCITGLQTVLIPYRKQLLNQMHAKRVLALKVNGLDRQRQ